MPQPRRRRRDGGFTLIEVVIALCVIVLTLIGLIAGISYASRTNATIQEDELALRAAQKKIEEIRSYPVGVVWACFNKNDNDALNLSPELLWNSTAFPEKKGGVDSDGKTYFPNQFEAEGLTPVRDDLDGYSWNSRHGLVTFPGDQTTNLVEITDLTDPMYDENGKDLNANAVEGESLVVQQRYNLLPVTITLRWKGVGGVRTMTFRYLLISIPTGTPADFVYPGQN
jgi:hypothetical protein